jgi:hypothetical protein
VSLHSGRECNVLTVFNGIDLWGEGLLQFLSFILLILLLIFNDAHKIMKVTLKLG